STIAEARAFAAAGFQDITWALPNPLSHTRAIFTLARLVTLRVLVDDLDAALALGEAAQQAGVRLHTWIKVDCGYHRAGVDPESPEAIALIRGVTEARSLIYDGILTHAGHSYHATTREEVERIARQERDVMLQLAVSAKGKGLDAK